MDTPRADAMPCERIDGRAVSIWRSHRRFETRSAFSVNWRPAGTARQGRFNPDGIQVRPYRDQARIYIIITSDGGRPGFAAPLPQMTNQIIPRGTGLAGCRRLPPRVLRWQRSIQGITAS